MGRAQTAVLHPGGREVAGAETGSRPLYYGGGRNGRAGNWVDGPAYQGTCQT
jgi:hypothetical protein